jgi:hypothetical protein
VTLSVLLPITGGDPSFGGHLLDQSGNIICTFGLVLILMAAVRPLLQRKAPLHELQRAD